MGQNKTWSHQEIELLKNLYPHYRIKQIFQRFPNRTKATIVAKALSIGLPSAKIWQSYEDKILREHFDISAKEILMSQLPKRTWPAIRARGERLSFKRKRNKPRLSVDEDYFKKWSANMSYLLGFIVADGCIIRGTYKGYSDSLKFGVQLRDRDILEKIKSELNAEHKISPTKNSVHFCISSQEIVNDLKRLNIKYRKSLKEKIPNVPAKYKRDFIRGIVDGDGSLYLSERNYPTLSVTGGENTIRFIRDHFFTKFQLYSKLTVNAYSKDIKKYLYSISYKANSAKKLIEYLYTDANLYLNRKYAIALRCLKTEIKTRRNTKYIKLYNETYTG